MGKSRLRVLLAEHDIHIKELAATAEIPYETVRAIVNGRRPWPDHAYELVDSLNALARKRYRFDQVFPNYYSTSSKKKLG